MKAMEGREEREVRGKKTKQARKKGWKKMKRGRD